MPTTARALVTGATGFIGRRLTQALLDKHWEVHALVLPGEEHKVTTGAHSVVGDLLDPIQIERAVEQVAPEIAVHLAWYTEPKDYLGSPDNVTMLRASLHLAQTLAKAGCQRLVGVGTGLEYAASAVPLREDAPTGPAYLYATCKLALHDVLTRYLHGRMAFAWTRVFWVYGPGERSVRLVPAVVRALLRGDEAPVSAGDQVRDFSHVADVARGIAHVAASSITGAVNVASGVPISVRSVVGEIARLIGREDLVRFGAMPSRPGEAPFIVADVEKLCESGFRPRFDLASGLAEAIDVWRREPPRD